MLTQPISKPDRTAQQSQRIILLTTQVLAFPSSQDFHDYLTRVLALDIAALNTQYPDIEPA